MTVHVKLHPALDRQRSGLIMMPPPRTASNPVAAGLAASANGMGTSTAFSVVGALYRR